MTTCSDLPSDTMLWIKEVEVVASALNKIIQSSHFKKKVSLEEQKAQKEDRFLQGRQIAFVIYDYFRVTGAHDTVLDHADLLLGKLCEDHGYTYHWTTGQKPHLTQNGKRMNCNIANYVPFIVPGLSTSSSTSSSLASTTSSSQDTVIST